MGHLYHSYVSICQPYIISLLDNNHPLFAPNSFHAFSISQSVPQICPCPLCRRVTRRVSHGSHGGALLAVVDADGECSEGTDSSDLDGIGLPFLYTWIHI